jgi:acyl-coenzyme A synthetase/AMP-(fatty) acid ligase
MSTPPNHGRFLWEILSNKDCSSRFLWGSDGQVAIGDLLQGSCLGDRRQELTGRSVLLSTHDQLAAAVVLIELDGIASRIVICPPDITAEHFPALIEKSGADAVVSDYELPDHACRHGVLRIVAGTVSPAWFQPVEHRATEWVLLTSGTTSAPKMIVHNLASLIAPIGAGTNPGSDVVWGTFYDIRRYGGLQIFLRALLGNGSMVFSGASESPTDHLARLAGRGVTHLSGTPSHWRRALMSPEAQRISPPYIRLSGEIADQAILNTLHAFYPNAAISHAFASTEAGVAFEVKDGLAGFPASLLGRHGDVELKVIDDSLRIRSGRIASRYLDNPSRVLADEDGFVDTGDIVELCGDRYYFLGRGNGVINVGGLKVYPEEVEAVINRHPAVRMSMVRSRRNPITGSLVSADVLLKESEPDGAATIRIEILEICRQSLPPHKVPATVRYVSSLDVAAAGKLARPRA